MRYRTVLLGILALFCSGSLLSQQPYLDSLRRVAFKSYQDTSSVNALTGLQRYFYGKGMFDSSLHYALLTLPVAENANDQYSIGRSNYNIGLIYSGFSKYDSAGYYLDKAETVATNIKDTVILAYTLNARAIIAGEQSDHQSAVEYLIHSNNLAETSQHPKLLSLIPQNYVRLGTNLIFEKQFEKGIFYSKKALTYSNYPDENRFRVITYLDIADAYLQLNNDSLGKVYLDSAILVESSMDNYRLRILVRNNEGNFYLKQKQHDKALNAYMEGYNLSVTHKIDYMKGELAGNIASLYEQKNELQKADQFARETIELGMQTRNFLIVANAYDVLKKVAFKQGDFKESLNYANQYKQFSDSATSKASQQTTLALESRYQHQKKEKEIASLQLENASRELAVVKRNRWLVIGGLIALTLGISLALLYRNSRQKQIISANEQRLQQEQIRFLQEQQQVVSLQSMINGQEAERTRIAKDLHDGLGGLFSTVKMHFSTLEHEVKELEQNELFRKSYSLVDTASVEVRRIAHNMMPEVLMKLGLIDALQDMCNNISAGKLLSISLQTYGMQQRLNSSTEIMLYRIVQELLNNIIKHAKATEAIVQFNRNEDNLTVTVEDNGRGFNTVDTDEKGHAGLGSVQSRVNYLKGKMVIESQNGLGTTVMMEFLLN